MLRSQFRAHRTGRSVASHLEACREGDGSPSSSSRKDAWSSKGTTAQDVHHGDCRRLLPPFRHPVGDGVVFVAGEAEANEPLLVELPRRLLQQPHPPPVVLDQVVVGGEDVSDSSFVP